MNDRQPSHQPGQDGVQRSAFDFHDPRFVEWWLGSLYLLPPEVQISVASSIKAVVHVPEVHAEVDLFAARFGEGPLVEPHALTSNETRDPSMTWKEQSLVDVVTSSFRRLWQERPSVVLLAALAVTVLVLRGLGALSTIFQLT